MVHRRAQKTNVNVMLAQSIILIVGKDITTLDFDSRQEFTKFEDHLAHDSAKPRCDSDLDDSGLAFLRLPGSLRGMTCLCEQFSGFLKKSMTCLGQFHPALVARK